MSSSLLRVRVRSATESTGKVVVARAGSTTLAELTRSAAEKLDMTANDGGESGQQQQLRLYLVGKYLGGEYLVEHINELRMDDELVL